MALINNISTKFVVIQSIRDNLSGILWMLAKCLAFSIISVIISKLSKDLNSIIILFWSMMVRLIVMGAWAAFQPSEKLVMHYPRLYIYRSLCSAISLMSWFYALKITPIGEATAISYITPLFTVIVAWFTLNEKLTKAHVTTIIIGLIGAIIIIKPTFDLSKQLGPLLAFFTTLMWAINDIITKIQARSEYIGVQTLFNTFFMTLFTLPIALYFWQTPTLKQALWVIIVGLLFIINNLSLTLSYKNADLVVVAPFSFSRLIFSLILAYILLHETIAIHKLIGAIIILLSNIYLIYLEKHTKKRSNLT